MAKRKRKTTPETFRSEMPSTVWPPTIPVRASAFVSSLRRVRGRGMAILAGALLMALGFFVIHGSVGTLLGVLGALMVLGALVWDRVRGL